MFWLQILSNFIKILREGQSPNQIAGGFALGAFVGLTPMLTLQGFLLWLVILVLDVNFSAVFLAAAIFAILGSLLDPLFHQLGYYLLVDAESLVPLWTAFYNAPLAPLTRFNNTIVLGSVVGSFILFVPTFFSMKRFVVTYRSTLGKRISTNKFYIALRQSGLVRWYEKARDFGGLS